MTSATTSAAAVIIVAAATDEHVERETQETPDVAEAPWCLFAWIVVALTCESLMPLEAVSNMALKHAL